MLDVVTPLTTIVTDLMDAVGDLLPVVGVAFGGFILINVAFRFVRRFTRG